MKTLVTLLGAMGCVICLAQFEAPDLLESSNYGGAGADYPYSIIDVSDGGYLVVGSSASPNGDVGGNYGGADYWVVKLNVDGGIVWEANYGGSQNDVARSAFETDEGDFVILGYTASSDVDVSENNGENDYWLIKIDATGDLIWEKSFGGSDDDFGIAMIPSADGGIITTGNTSSNDGDIAENNGDRDVWITKHSSNGDLIWERTFGGSEADAGLALVENEAGNIVVTGNTGSTDGDVIGNHGSADAWTLMLDDEGDLIWQRCSGERVWITRMP